MRRKAPATWVLEAGGNIDGNPEKHDGAKDCLESTHRLAAISGN